MSIVGACIVIAISACVGMCIPVVIGKIMIWTAERKEEHND